MRVRRQPFVRMLDDDQLAIADQAGAGIDHDAVGGRQDRLACAAGDVDALLGLVAADIAADDLALRRPAPSRCSDDRRCRPHGRCWHGCRRSRRRGGCGGSSARARRRRHRPRRTQAQALPDFDRVRVADAVPRRHVLVAKAEAEGDSVKRFAGAHDMHGARGNGRRRGARDGRAGAGGTGRTRRRAIVIAPRNARMTTRR